MCRLDLPGLRRSASRVLSAWGSPQPPRAAPPARHRPVRVRPEAAKGRLRAGARTIVADDKGIQETVRARLRDAATKLGAKAATQVAGAIAEQITAKAPMVETGAAEIKAVATMTAKAAATAARVATEEAAAKGATVAGVATVAGAAARAAGMDAIDVMRA
jgi:hypothetical protein